jgi:hypothetical protein
MSKAQEVEGGAKLKRKQYEEELRRFQAELCILQDWVKHKGLRVIVLFEGRDGAGKGGTIRALTERVARAFRSREDPEVHSAVYAVLPGGRRDRDFRPQLVQPRQGSNM